MKKIFYLCVVAFMAIASSTKAQYFDSSSWVGIYDTGSICNDPMIYLRVSFYIPGLSVLTYYGDGDSSSHSLLSGGGGTNAYADISHNYAFPGTYTLKDILYSGGVPIDTIVQIHEYLFCSTFIIKFFYDSTGLGVYDSTFNSYTNMSHSIEISKNGIPYDTVSMGSGLYYQVTGIVGDIYSFKILNLNSGFVLTCPSSGIIYDTIAAINNEYSVKYFGIKCSSSGGFDLQEQVSNFATTYGFISSISVQNAYCLPKNGMLTMHFSPKYSYYSAIPSPSTIIGNTITWNIAGISDITPPFNFNVALNVTGAPLTLGDTVHTDYTLTPTTGDADTANNYILSIIHIRSSFDPNEMSVSPSGIIAAGTQLQYTINFENTGNDTAFNISVYDTLSDNVDVKSLNIVMASAVMNIAVLNYGGHNIVKFDFPNINLLDSSHHGQCDGAVIFTINTYNGLLTGITIFNHAGIFFDYNPVVMTDTVEDIIGTPSGVSAVSKPAKAEVYPNPANDELTVKMDNGAYNTMSITNMVGQELMTQPISNTLTTVNVKLLPAGLYIITLKGDSGVEMRKFEKL